MKLRSLRARLAAVWGLSLAAACAVGLLLVQLFNLSSSAQMARADAALAQACDRIGDRYAYYTAGWAAPPHPSDDPAFRADLAAVATLALSGSAGIEGGLWQQDAGMLADVFPTYGGTRPKAALAQEDVARLKDLTDTALQDDHPATSQAASGTQTLMLRACPLPGPVSGLAGWTLTRVAEETGWDKLRLGLGVLMALVLALSGWLTWLVLAWTRHIGRIETALASAGESDLPRIAATGEAELDRIVAALNTAGSRLAEARRRGADLSARAAGTGDAAPRAGRQRRQSSRGGAPARDSPATSVREATPLRHRHAVRIADAGVGKPDAGALGCIRYFVKTQGSYPVVC